MQLRTTHWWKVPCAKKIEELKQNDFLKQAALLLREGGLVAFPTETVYGLGADATNEEAVSSIFTAKGRPSDNPLIVHLGDVEQLKDWVAEIPEVAQQLIEHFWPGPLTLVFPHNGGVAPQVTAGLSTVAIRIPEHPVAQALLQLAQVPVAAPSANRSGRPSPTLASHVWKDLSGRIDLLLDGGATGVGVESTVVDVTERTPVLLRPGGVSLEELRRVIGEVQVDQGLISEKTTPRSPGMKYRHYAPQGEMWIVSGNEQKMRARIAQLAQEAMREKRKVGILTTEEFQDQYQADLVLACGRRDEPASVAKALYHTLRRFDDEDVELVLAESFPELGLYHSVMNRLRKAAGGKIIRV